MGKPVVPKLLVILLPVILLVGGYYLFQKKNLLKQNEAELTAIANDRKNTLIDYFKGHLQQLAALAHESTTTKTLESLIKSNDATALKNFEDFLESKDLKQKFPQLFLISTAGNVLYSFDKRNEYGTNLKTGPYKDEAIAESFLRVIMTVAPDIADTNFYEPTKRAALFISVPVFLNNRLLGVLAVQLNFQEVLSSVSGYEGLGRTGEIVLAKRRGDDLFFVSNIRNVMSADSFETSKSSTGTLLSQQTVVQGERIPLVNENPLTEATVGNNTSGMANDFRLHKVVAVGTYIPYADWGMVVKKDLNEILSPTYAIKVLLIILLITFITLILFLISDIILSFQGIAELSNIILVTAFLISSVILGYIIYSYRNENKNLLKSTLSYAQAKIEYVEKEINLKTNYVEYSAHAFVTDLTQGSLSQQDLAVRIKRELGENADILAISVINPLDTDLGLYGVKSKKGITISPLKSFQEAPWHAKIAGAGSAWIDKLQEPFTKTAVAAYVVPFKTQSGKQGTVTVMLDLEPIRKLMSTLELTKRSYSILLGKDEKILYYPLKEYGDSTSLEKLSERLNNSSLKTISHALQRGVKKTINEIDHNAWFLYKPITKTQWSVIIVIVNRDVVLPPTTISNYSLLILFFATLAAAFLILFILFLLQVHLWLCSAAVSFILFMGLIFSWLIINNYVAQSINKELIITDQLGLTRFLGELQDQAREVHRQQPIPLETGFLITSLSSGAISTPDKQRISFIGYIWQRYQDGIHDKIARAIRFPESFKSSITEAYRQKIDGTETVVWSVICELFESSEDRHYPFDIKNIKIMLEHPQKDLPVVLVPDLTSYVNMGPKNLPGLDTKASFAGFSPEESFFTYKSTSSSATVGFKKDAATTFDLVFNIVLKRKLVNPFIIFVIPLLVILISIFLICCLLENSTAEERNKRSFGLNALSIFIAIFFTLILLHRTLRDEFQASEISYLEYLFFFSYLTLLAVQLYFILIPLGIKISHKKHRPSSVIELFFWPVELCLFLVCTVLMFYNP